MKKVSVIIPMHNSSKHIEECIDSVLNQTYSNIEVIVVDDSSSDDSVHIVEGKIEERIEGRSPSKIESKVEGKSSISVKIIKLDKNVGAASARNIGIEASTGDFVCFLDSDDYWTLDKIEKQVDFIEQNNYAFIYSDYAYLRKGEVQHIAHVPRSIDYAGALKNTTIFTSTVMFNMAYLSKEDIYMPNIKKGQDTATWWKVLKKGITAYAINEVLAYYRVGEKSLSSNKFKALKRTWDLYKRENIGYFRKVHCFICYVFNAVKRRYS